MSPVVPPTCILSWVSGAPDYGPDVCVSRPSSSAPLGPLTGEVNNLWRWGRIRQQMNILSSRMMCWKQDKKDGRWSVSTTAALVLGLPAPSEVM